MRESVREQVTVLQQCICERDTVEDVRESNKCKEERV